MAILTAQINLNGIKEGKEDANMYTIKNYFFAYVLCTVACCIECNNSSMPPVQTSSILSGLETTKMDSYELYTEAAAAFAEYNDQQEEPIILPSPTMRESFEKVRNRKWNELSKKDMWNICTACTGLCLATYCSYYCLTRYKTVCAQKLVEQQIANRNRIEQQIAQLRQRDGLAQDMDGAAQLCSSCWDDRKAKTCVYLHSCGHFNCTNCAKDIVKIAVRDKSNDGLACVECKAKLTTENDFEDLTNAGIFDHDPKEEDDKFKNMNRAEYIDSLKANAFKASAATNPNAKQCPTANCNTIFINSKTAQFLYYIFGITSDVTCQECNKTYCSTCLVPHNHRFPCVSGTENIDADTLEFINTGTKKCPNCATHIQKNEGCLHMTCRRQGCGHEFCWQCKGPWYSSFGARTHNDNYSCSASGAGT